MNRLKGWIGDLTDITVSLLALGVVVGIVFGGGDAPIPFIGTVLDSFISTVGSIGDAGVVGLIVLAILANMYGGRGGSM